jgi:hypothetical protein
MFSNLMKARQIEPGSNVEPEILEGVEQKTVALLREVQTFVSIGENGVDVDTVASDIREKLEAILRLLLVVKRYSETRSRDLSEIANRLAAVLEDEPCSWEILFSWAFTHNLGSAVRAEDAAERSRTWIDEWLLGKLIATTLQDSGTEESAAWHAVAILKLLITRQNWMKIDPSENNKVLEVLLSLLADGDVQNYLMVNRYQDVLWFNKEAFDRLLDWMMVLSTISVMAESEVFDEDTDNQLTIDYGVIKALKNAEVLSDYQLDKLIEVTSTSK